MFSTENMEFPNQILDLLNDNLRICSLHCCDEAKQLFTKKIHLHVCDKTGKHVRKTVLNRDHATNT